VDLLVRGHAIAVFLRQPKSPNESRRQRAAPNVSRPAATTPANCPLYSSPLQRANRALFGSNSAERILIIPSACPLPSCIGGHVLALSLLRLRNNRYIALSRQCRPQPGRCIQGKRILFPGKLVADRQKSLNAEGAEENAKAATAPSATFAKPPRPLR